MPWLGWRRDACCPNGEPGAYAERACPHCGRPGTFDGWRLSLYEALAQYQYAYRVRPTGPHRDLTDRLLTPLRDRCPRCRGRGILTLVGGDAWRGCPECEGTGGSWCAPEEQVQAAYATILEIFPEAAAPDAPSEFLTGAVAYDHDHRLMISPGPGSGRRERQPRGTFGWLMVRPCAPERAAERRGRPRGHVPPAEQAPEAE